MKDKKHDGISVEPPEGKPVTPHDADSAPPANDAAAEQPENRKKKGHAETRDTSESKQQATPSDEAPEPTAKEPDETEQLRDKLLRLHADFDNYRKRMARDHQEMIKRANEDLIASMLPVLDHIGHAEAMMEKQADATVAPYLEGFRMVKQELLKALDDYGVKPIETDGVQFDANRHDALSAQHSDVAQAGEILFEVRRGYLLHGRVLRAAQVIVASEDSGATPDANAEPAETTVDPASTGE